MKTKLFLALVLLFLSAGLVQGQEKHPLFLFVESGIEFISCEQPSKDYIRADIEPYYDHYPSSSIRALMHNDLFGVRIEYRIARNLLGISAGLRYSRMITSIGKPAYWSDSPEFFYVHYRTDGLNTEYARVHELTQKADYIGIPVELRIYPYAEHLINFYYKAGATFNINAGSKTDVAFFDDKMDPYKGDVAEVVESAYSFYGSFNLGIGIKVGRLPKPGFIVEASFPIGMLTPGKDSFVSPEAGAGAMIMVRIPLNKKTEK